MIISTESVPEKVRPMPQPLALLPTREEDIHKVMTEAAVDADVYGRLLNLDRGAKYRALKSGQPIKPFKAGREWRIATPPLRELLHLA